MNTIKERKRTITIGRGCYGFYYSDDSGNRIECTTMIEAFGMLSARIGATLQHNDDFDEKVEYAIDITRIMLE